LSDLVSGRHSEDHLREIRRQAQIIVDAALATDAVITKSA
jgi:hypothetical protein